MFEEAYFILSDEAKRKQSSEGDILNEARRLIADSPVCNYWGLRSEDAVKRGEKSAAQVAKRPNFLSCAISFALGGLFAAVPLLTVILLGAG